MHRRPDDTDYAPNIQIPDLSRYQSTRRQHIHRDARIMSHSLNINHFRFRPPSLVLRGMLKDQCTHLRRDGMSE